MIPHRNTHVPRTSCKGGTGGKRKSPKGIGGLDADRSGLLRTRRGNPLRCREWKWSGRGSCDLFCKAGEGKGRSSRRFNSMAMPWKIRPFPGFATQDAGFERNFDNPEGCLPSAMECRRRREPGPQNRAMEFWRKSGRPDGEMSVIYLSLYSFSDWPEDPVPSNFSSRSAESSESWAIVST